MIIQWAHPASLELEEAVAWYEAQSPGLGDKFLGEIVIATTLITQFPTAWHPISKRARSHRLNRFPYSLIYTLAVTDSVVIVALAHQHRKPLYWRDRIASF